jgi:hypothetical protein
MSTALAVVAAVNADPSGEGAKAGPWGLAVILLLCIVCYFLFKSMSKHLRKVREEFPTGDADPAAADTASAPSLAKADPTQAEDAPASDDKPE